MTYIRTDGGKWKIGQCSVGPETAIPEIHKIKHLHINTQIFPSLGALLNISKEAVVYHGEGERMLGSSQFIGDYNLAAGHHQPQSCSMQCIIFAIFAKSQMSNILIGFVRKTPF